MLIREYHRGTREEDMEEPTEKLIYQEMSQEESTLDWQVTTTVMADTTLMKTLEESQSLGRSTRSSRGWRTG